MQSQSPPKEPPLLVPIDRSGSPLRITVDGIPVEGHAGQSILAAVLCAGDMLNRNEATGAPRAGFCLMGVCQDCWVWFENGDRARACTTEIAEGMAILTEPPAGFVQHG